jgi:ketosteroid isomerase-like protein
VGSACPWLATVTSRHLEHHGSLGYLPSYTGSRFAVPTRRRLRRSRRNRFEQGTVSGIVRMALVLWVAPTIILASTIGLAIWQLCRRACPELSKATLRAALDVYKNAWEQQDSELILTIFTRDAVYHERVLQEPIRGHEGIAAYWREKVVKGQGRISFTLLKTYIDGSTGIAEWEVHFDDLVQRKRKRMKEIALLEFVEGKIASLREYWTSEVIGEV